MLMCLHFYKATLLFPSASSCGPVAEQHHCAAPNLRNSRSLKHRKGVLNVNFHCIPLIVMHKFGSELYPASIGSCPTLTSACFNAFFHVDHPVRNLFHVRLFAPTCGEEVILRDVHSTLFDQVRPSVHRMLIAFYLISSWSPRDILELVKYFNEIGISQLVSHEHKIIWSLSTLGQSCWCRARYGRSGLGFYVR